MSFEIQFMVSNHNKCNTYVQHPLMYGPTYDTMVEKPADSYTATWNKWFHGTTRWHRVAEYYMYITDVYNGIVRYTINCASPMVRCLAFILKWNSTRDMCNMWHHRKPHLKLINYLQSSFMKLSGAFLCTGRMSLLWFCLPNEHNKPHGTIHLRDMLTTTAWT